MTGLGVRKTIALVCLQLLPFSYCFADEPRIQFAAPVPRPHELTESVQYVGYIYIISTLAYLQISHDEVFNNASFQNYGRNFGNMTLFDQDLPSANWGVHLLTGSFLFEFYRARNYTLTDAFFLTLIQECLFQFTVETLIQPTAIEDVMGTAIVGSIIGRGLELVSLPLLNSDFIVFKGLGYVLNLPALLGFWESKATVTPILGPGTKGVELQVRF